MSFDFPPGTRERDVNGSGECGFCGRRVHPLSEAEKCECGAELTEPRREYRTQAETKDDE